jgi:molybdopterin-guanine dinucleotide biosynthesis protein A
VVLAGGRGQRVGGLDKGWIELGSRPLIAHVLARFAPQASEIIISANRNLDRYAGFGHAVLADEVPGFAGPLAGLLAAFSRARFGLVCTVPCDSPFVPLDLVVRLHSAMEENEADVAVARTGDRIHPVFALYRRDLRTTLGDYLASGERMVQAWQARQRRVEVSFDDTPEGFRNINTLEELAKLRRRP